MKTLTHIVLPIVILMAVVGIVAYMTQNTTRSDTKPNARNSAAAVPAAPEAEFVAFTGEQLPVTSEELLIEEKRMEEIEPHSKNVRDYVFYSTQATPFRLSYVKNCKCTTVDIGTIELSDEQLEAIGNHPSLTGYVDLAKALSSAKFTPLPEGEDSQKSGVLIAKALPGKVKRPYILRIIWDAKEPDDPKMPSPETVQVRLYARAEGSSALAKTDVYIRSVVVPPVDFAPKAFDLGEVEPGSPQTVNCVFFSGTRKHLDATMRLTGANGKNSTEPCAEFSPCIPLPQDERDALPSKLGKMYALAKFQSAYAYSFTLHEKLGDNEMELGSLVRRVIIHFNTPPDEAPIEDVSLPVSFSVRGGVHLLNGDSNARFPLGRFKSERGTSMIAKLHADDPKLEIKVEQVNDPKIKATLRSSSTAEGGKDWELVVDVEPGVIGQLPPNTTVLLQTVGAKPRRMRIPLTGFGDR